MENPHAIRILATAAGVTPQRKPKFDLVVRVRVPTTPTLAGGLEVQHVRREDRYEVYRHCQSAASNNAATGSALASVGAEKVIELCVCAM